MINFPHSTFTWKAHPWKPDSRYKYGGGFVGKPGQVYHVRFNLEAKCDIKEDATGQLSEIFVGAPCQTEYTIARRNLFQIPSGQFRMAFSRKFWLRIAKIPSFEKEKAEAFNLEESFQDHTIDIRNFPETRKLTLSRDIVEATLGNDLLNGHSTFRKHGFTVAVEYPINLININQADEEFQVCTGPVILPDLETWDGEEVKRVFLAHVAFSAFDYVEFILRREVEPADSEKIWLDKPRGRDRFELLDPDHSPPGFPPGRPRPTVYNETWELEAANVMLCARNV